MNKMLEGKTAVVTGGSSGIGQAIALCFAKQGARVIITGRKLEPLQETAALNENLIVFQGDMTDSKTIAALAKTVQDVFAGKLDILVNNAGWCPVKPITEITMDDFNKAFSLDVEAVVDTTIQMLPMLLAAKGNIINLSSVGAEHPAPNLSLYVGAKAAIENFTRVWAAELAPKGMRVNAIAPGPIETNIWKVPGMDPAAAKAHEARIVATVPMGRMGHPDEVAQVALFLASDMSSYCTGSIYAVDGGEGAIS